MIIETNCHVETGFFADELLFAKTDESESLFTKAEINVVEPENLGYEDSEIVTETANITLAFEVPEGTKLCKLSQKREYTKDFEISYEWEFSRFDWERRNFKPVFNKKVDCYETTEHYKVRTIEDYQNRIESAKKLYQKLLTELLEEGYVAY